MYLWGNGSMEIQKEMVNLIMGVDCPNCGAARIVLNGTSELDDIQCPKCGVQLILDALNLTGVYERSFRHGSDAPVERASSA